MARITYEGLYHSVHTSRDRRGKNGSSISVSVRNNHRGVRTSEFPTEGLYATEQGADIHGITFGQRVIDGKVEGLSVPPDPRRVHGVGILAHCSPTNRGFFLMWSLLTVRQSEIRLLAYAIGIWPGALVASVPPASGQSTNKVRFRKGPGFISAPLSEQL
jgi:hypothetical protein